VQALNAQKRAMDYAIMRISKIIKRCSMIFSLKLHVITFPFLDKIICDRSD